ncbi:hypothetical protein LARI1_G009234 [Lachnellula arida]|uniref:Ubiquitin 3 binding protein But2 C-terminal domain-containing protein n=1 Tax=Lachnellula arida TaxID=1316785 RepID=A0A8T9B1U0_9HELO|nr:hypothetical protein LARI1_G009234 [Lachnellula arida]
MLPRQILLLSAFTALTVASPVEQTRQLGHANVCGVVNPATTLIQLQQNSPNTTFPNTANSTNGGGSVGISQGGQGVSQVQELIGFSPPPAGSYGCTLGVTFPSDYTFPTLSGSPPTLNVYTLAQPLPPNPTFSNSKPGYLFGTVTIMAGQSTIINSISCTTPLVYMFSYADFITGSGAVGWNQHINNNGNTQKLRGVYLSYNC